MVTIIVVSYNHSKFVTTCLDSIKNQSYKDYSLIVIDDFSQDNSSEIIDKWVYENPNISVKTKFNKENVGLCNNLNWALQQSASEYVKIIAADDFLHTKYLEQAVKTMNTLSNDYKILYTKAKYVDENNTILPEKNYYERDNMPIGNVENFLFSENFVCAASVLLRRDIYEQTGYYDPDIILEDYELWLNAATKGIKFIFLSETLVYYRHHSDNITKKKQNRIHNESISLKMKYDTTGKYKAVVHRGLSFIYEKNNLALSSELIGNYSKYKGRDSIFYFMIKNRFPSFLVKIYTKFFM